MGKPPEARLCRTRNELEVLLHMEYRLRCGPPLAAIAEPRTRSFIVVEWSKTPLQEDTGRGKACIYLLAKRGVSTPEAAAALARYLGAVAHPLGLKDTEATTLQRVCVQPCPEEPPRTIRGRGYWARLEGRVRSCRRLRLHGNTFIILLRPLPGHNSDEIIEVVATLARQPLPAYYSFQRFGTRRPSTHYAGLASLIEPHSVVVREVLDTAYPDEAPEHIRCRRMLWQDPVCLTSTRMYEASLAVDAPWPRLPRFLRSIHASALQASIFNAYLTLRIEHGIGLGELIPGEKRDAKGRPLAPIPAVGGKTRVTGLARRLLREALELHGLSLEDLAKRPPGLLARVEQYWRPVYTLPLGLQAEKRGNNLVVLRFTLEKGQYATTLLRELVEPGML